MLHRGALTLGMDMVKHWRHISRIYGHYLIIVGAHFVEFVMLSPFCVVNKEMMSQGPQVAYMECRETT
jgi:hypothetical protein